MPNTQGWTNELVNYKYFSFYIKLKHSTCFTEFTSKHLHNQNSNNTCSNCSPSVYWNTPNNGGPVLKRPKEHAQLLGFVHKTASNLKLPHTTFMHLTNAAFPKTLSVRHFVMRQHFLV